MNSNPNDLLERYLQAVGWYLPASTREDTLAELRANLLEQMDARAEELARPLTDADVASILIAHGRPEVVAARYLPQRSLIGPGLFPTYLLALRKAAPFVAFIYFIVKGIAFVASNTTPLTVSYLVSFVVEAILGFVPTLLYFWGVVTLVFAAIEFSHEHFAKTKNWPNGCTWDPGKLPPVKTEDGTIKPRSMATRVAELIVHCLWMIYVLSIPAYPVIFFGPGRWWLAAHGLGLAPVWHTFFLMLIVLLFMQLAMKIIAIANQYSAAIQPLKITTDLLGAAGTAVLAFATEYVVATSASANVAEIAQVNHAMMLAFRIAFLFAAIGVVSNSWKLIKGYIPTQRLAF